MGKMPKISVNFAISGDGKISDENGRKSGWTSQEDGARLKELRRGADAILVGRRTLQADRMTMRVTEQEWQPLRCVVSRSGIFTGDEPLFHTAGGPIHLLAQKVAALSHRQDIQWHTGSLADFLRCLHEEFGVNHLHCEGGGNLMQAIFDIHPPELIHLTWAAHTFFGGEASPTISGVPLAISNRKIVSSVRYQLQSGNLSAYGGEMFLTYELADKCQ